MAKFRAVNRNTSKFDFTFEVIPGDNKIDVNLEYDTDLFKEKNMYRLIHHYIHILEQMCKNPNMRLKDIEMILKKKR